MPITTAVWADDSSEPPQVTAEHDSATDAVRIAIGEPDEAARVVRLYLHLETAASLWRQLGDIPEVAEAARVTGGAR